MQGDEWRETNEGRGIQEQARMEITKGDKGRETNEGRSSQEQARMEITKGDKGRETNEGRSSQEQAKIEIMQGDKWRETNEGRSGQEQAKIEIMQGDKWRETRWQRQGFWGSATQSLRSKNPYSFQLSGEKNIQTAKHTYSPIGFGLHKLLCLVKDPPLLLSPSFVRDDPLDRGPSVVVWDPPRTFVRDSQSQMPCSRLATLSLREPRLCYWPVQDPRLCSRTPVRDF